MTRSVCAALAFSIIACISAGAEGSQQDALVSVNTATAKNYPQIVLYSVPWCPVCKETKEYLAKNNIPYKNRNVEADTKAMEDLTIKYGSTGVPVIVFGKGNDEVIMKGFTPELFQESLQKARLK